MTSVTAAVAIRDELALGRTSTEQLGEVANREHACANRAAMGMVVHGVRAGEALLEARERVPYGQWGEWLEQNFHASVFTARIYMRFAQHKVAIRQRGITRYPDALSYVRAVAAEERPSLEQQVARREEARVLYAQGDHSLRDLADRFEVDPATAHRWVSDARRERDYQNKREKRPKKWSGPALDRSLERIRRSLATLERICSADADNVALAQALQDFRMAEANLLRALR